MLAEPDRPAYPKDASSERRGSRASFESHLQRILRFLMDPNQGQVKVPGHLVAN
jgi:hypothetical protein